jgi:hypothetical protein
MTSVVVVVVVIVIVVVVKIIKKVNYPVTGPVWLRWWVEV